VQSIQPKGESKMNFIRNLFGEKKPKVKTIENGVAEIAAVFKSVEGRTFSSVAGLKKRMEDELEKAFRTQVSCSNCSEIFVIAGNNEQIHETGRITIHITCPKCKKRVTEDLIGYKSAKVVQ
jgi:metal-responsive CopG/Arc/MetJ family transcriptional regulator